jgi:hypothetical protein
MAPRGRKADLGEPVFVLQGKTEHHAFLLKGYPPIIKFGIPHLWIQWGSTDNREPVPEKDVRREVELSGRRSRRATLKVKDEKQEQECKQKEMAPVPKRKQICVKKTQAPLNAEDNKRMQTYATKTDENVACWNAEGSSASSVLLPAREEAEMHEKQEKKRALSTLAPKSLAPKWYSPPRRVIPSNTVHATQAAEIRLIASPPRAAPGRVLNIVEGDKVLVKDQGWAFVESSPTKGNHPNQIQIQIHWGGPDGTTLNDCVSEDNILVHIPKKKPADMKGEVLRLADELFLTVDHKKMTVGALCYYVLQACDIETEENDYYAIIKERVRDLATGGVQPRC